jgi:hypothetical protein
MGAAQRIYLPTHRFWCAAWLGLVRAAAQPNGRIEITLSNGVPVCLDSKVDGAALRRVAAIKRTSSVEDDVQGAHKMAGRRLRSRNRNIKPKETDYGSI